MDQFYPPVKAKPSYIAKSVLICFTFKAGFYVNLQQKAI